MYHTLCCYAYVALVGSVSALTISPTAKLLSGTSTAPTSSVQASNVNSSISLLDSYGVPVFTTPTASSIVHPVSTVTIYRTSTQTEIQHINTCSCPPLRTTDNVDSTASQHVASGSSGSIVLGGGLLVGGDYNENQGNTQGGQSGDKSDQTRPNEKIVTFLTISTIYQTLPPSTFTTIITIPGQGAVVQTLTSTSIVTRFATSTITATETASATEQSVPNNSNLPPNGRASVEPGVKYENSTMSGDVFAARTSSSPYLSLSSSGATEHTMTDPVRSTPPSTTSSRKGADTDASGLNTFISPTTATTSTVESSVSIAAGGMSSSFSGSTTAPTASALSIPNTLPSSNGVFDSTSSSTAGLDSTSTSLASISSVALLSSSISSTSTPASSQLAPSIVTSSSGLDTLTTSIVSGSTSSVISTLPTPVGIAQVVVNPGFEDDPTSTQQKNEPWILAGGDNGYLQDGANHYVLLYSNDFRVQTLSQTISTLVPGATYSLQYSILVYFDQPNLECSFTVKLGNTLVDSIPTPVPATAGFVVRTAQVVATSITEVLQFSYDCPGQPFGSDIQEVELDDITLSLQ